MRKFLVGLGFVLSACGAAAGGGGTVQSHGGAEGSYCNTQYSSEGCLNLDRMKCVGDGAAAADGGGASDGKWQKIASCPANVTYCEEKASGSTLTTACTALSSGTTPTTTDTVSGSDAGSDTGSTYNYAQMKACVQSKCVSELAACKADSVCGPAINCSLACNDEACQDKCPSMSGDSNVSMALAACIIKSQCVPTTQPTDTCGDGKCSGSETASSCPQDCKTTTTPVCGDGKCEGTESDTCLQDCKTGPVCGNGTCESGETTSSCPSDCKTASKCGNGFCDAGETKASCPSDCGTTTTAICGDGQCSSGESCAMDCSSVYGPTIQCGWNSCKSEMTACQNSSDCVAFFNCAAACTDCNDACLKACIMGPGIKAQTQITNISNCAQTAECPNPCPTASPVCGNGTCESGETAASCASDCGTATSCGNGTCESGETAASCPSDCGTTTGHYCDSHCGSSGNGCYCDASCKQYGDCCDATGSGKSGKTCAGSTCAECK